MLSCPALVADDSTTLTADVTASHVGERNTIRLVEWRVNKVPEAFSRSKMAYQTLQQEYLQIPVVTRAYTTACVLTTAAVVRQMFNFTVLVRAKLSVV